VTAEVDADVFSITKIDISTILAMRLLWAEIVINAADSVIGISCIIDATSVSQVHVLLMAEKCLSLPLNSVYVFKTAEKLRIN
jgi:hypothetical protein